MAVKEERVKKEIQYISEDRDRATTIAVKHLIHPTEDALKEVSNLPIGALHSLIMLQAYEEQMASLIVQIRAMQQWYILRSIRRRYMTWNKQTKVYDYKENWNNEKCQIVFEEEFEQVKKLDTIDNADMFVHRFRRAYYQHSRGKEGWLADFVSMLSDTEMQTRSPDLEDAFRSPTRNQ